MSFELIAVDGGDMTNYDMARCRRDPDWVELGEVVGVFEEAEQVGVGEVGGDFRCDGILIN